MSLQLRATKHQLADFKRLVELGPQRLAQVQSGLQHLQAPTLRPEELLSEAGKFVNEDDAERLVRQLLSLQGLVRQSGQTVDDVFGGLRLAIEQQGSEAGISVDEWLTIEDKVKSLVQLKSVRLAATAIELAYDYANLLRRTKILTDIRPLYDEPGDTIEGAVISYTLRLRYDSADGEHELSIALDEADIVNLIRQCERALRKAGVARSLMTEKCNIAVSVSGEVNDD